MQKKIRKAVIPAAGLGTRFLPATKAQPKEMLPIVDKPTLQYIIEEAVESGIEEILIITGKNKKSIEDHFDKSVELELELEQKGKTELLEIVRNITKRLFVFNNKSTDQKDKVIQTNTIRMERLLKAIETNGFIQRLARKRCDDLKRCIAERRRI